jgi:hypothetical protein
MSINWKSRFMTLAFARFLSDRALVPEDANYAFRSPRQNTGSQIASVATSRHQALQGQEGDNRRFARSVHRFLPRRFIDL